MASTNKFGIDPDEIERPTGSLAEPINFKYDKPELKGIRGLVPLCKSDITLGMVQVINKGGENNMHSHGNMDTIWFVLGGKVRFYGPGDKIYGEYGKHEGIFMPRDCAYWFESISDEPLELLQCGSFTKDEDVSFRTDYEPKKASAKSVEMFGQDGTHVDYSVDS